MRLMHINRRTALGALALAMGAGSLTACSDFLTGPGLTRNPNQPTVVDAPELLFVATQASLNTQQEGQLARLAGMYTGQLSGIGRQQASYQRYELTENDVTAYFSRNYTGGGLVDLREVQRVTKERGDSVFAAQAMIVEGLVMGTAASLWGDLPYSQAGDPVAFPTPRLDPQRDVYAQVFAKLDTATTWIVKTGGLNRGAGTADIIYGTADSVALNSWRMAANTLKARFWMHLIEREGNAAADSARRYALLGINSATRDFRTWHSTSTTDQNIWWRFNFNDRSGDLGPGQRLITVMTTRPEGLGIPDPRLPEYFTPATSAGGVYRGGDENGAVPAGISAFSATRFNQGFRQPIITYVETQLILAETNARLGAEPAALTALNNARRAAGFTAAQDIPASVTGAALLRAIAEEKYVAMFQNIEVWNDFKRNCYPSDLRPPSGQPALAARVPYGFAERNANPNIPRISDFLARNWNDPNPCTATN